MNRWKIQFALNYLLKIINYKSINSFFFEKTTATILPIKRQCEKQISKPLSDSQNGPYSVSYY